MTAFGKSNPAEMSVRQSDSTQPRPLYRQVKDYINRNIDSGAWLPDTRIPSENELVETFQVSRMTVNRALRELTDEGHIVRLQGVGTFVAHPKPQLALFDIKSISHEISNRGGVHTSRIHIQREEETTPNLAVAMDLPTQAPVFHTVIIHYHSGCPIQVADRHVNPAIFPDYLNQDFIKETPADYLLRIAPVSEAEHIIEAVRPDPHMQQLLDLGHEEPCLVLHRRTWVGRVIATKSRFIYPGSRYQIGGRFKPSRQYFH